MADKEISELTAADPLDGDELLHVVQGGNSRRATTQAIADRSRVLRGHIFGLALSNSTLDADNDIDIAPGEAASDDTSPVLITLSSAITKRLDAAWAVGTGNGGLDTGTKANSTWYHLWLIRRSDTGVVDALFSTSATTPTMPTNYDQQRRIGAVGTNGSGNIRAFIQDGDEFRHNSSGVSEYTGGTRAKAALTCAGIPTGIRVQGIFKSKIGANTGDVSSGMIVYDGLYANIADELGVYTSTGAVQSIAVLLARTNLSAQIELEIQANATAASNLTTLGWIDTRGREA